jgi:hypothetical protein
MNRIPGLALYVGLVMLAFLLRVFWGLSLLDLAK